MVDRDTSGPEPVTDADGNLRFPPPTSEPYVDRTFPDSEYDADPEFGRPGGAHGEDDDDDDGADEDDGEPGGEGDAGEGDDADHRRRDALADFLHDDPAVLRRRLRTAVERDRSDAEAGGGGGRARSFAEGASRLAGAGAGVAGDGGPRVNLKRRRVGTVAKRGKRTADLVLYAVRVNGLTSLKTSEVSLTFRVLHSQAMEAFKLHEFKDMPLDIHIFKALDDEGD